MDKRIIHEVDRFRAQSGLRAHLDCRAGAEADLAGAQTQLERARAYFWIDYADREIAKWEAEIRRLEAEDATR